MFHPPSPGGRLFVEPERQPPRQRAPQVAGTIWRPGGATLSYVKAPNHLAATAGARRRVNHTLHRSAAASQSHPLFLKLSGQIWQGSRWGASARSRYPDSVSSREDVDTSVGLLAR